MSCCLALWLRPSLTYMEALQVMSQPHAARLTEMTSFFPPPTQTVIEDVFSNGVKKKKKKNAGISLGWPFKSCTWYMQVLFWSGELGLKSLLCGRKWRSALTQRMSLYLNASSSVVQSACIFYTDMKMPCEVTFFFQWNRLGETMMAVSFVDQN